MVQSRIVLLVDHDPESRECTRELLQGCGYDVHSLVTADEFRAWTREPMPHCLLMDQELAAALGCDHAGFVAHHAAGVPVVFLSRQADMRAAVGAMKAGAIDFLTRPLRDVELLEAVAIAVECGDELRARQVRQERGRALVARLTRREREVFELLLEGKRNKVIAAELASQESTVKVHRSRLMRKLEVRSLAQLVKLGGVLERPAASVQPQAAATSPARIPAPDFRIPF